MIKRTMFGLLAEQEATKSKEVSTFNIMTEKVKNEMK